MKKTLVILGALALTTPSAVAQTAGSASRAPRVSAPSASGQAAPAPEARFHRRQAPNAPNGQGAPAAPAPRPMIGVRIAPLDNSVSAQLPEHMMPAIRLTTVFPDSPADRAGLRVNDVITAIDGDGQATVENLIDTVTAKKVGDLVRLDVSRGGQTQVFNVPVETMTPPPIEHRPRTIPEMDFWKDYAGQHAWPRFGVRHDGKIMVQGAEGDEWHETEANSQLHDAWKNALRDDIDGDGDQDVYLDLTRPDVDPQGQLRRQLEHLHSLYRSTQHDVAQGQQQASQRLEQRIERLEAKVDEIHRMLSELTGRTR